MRKKQNFQWDKLSIGACYYPEHWDRSLWREDMERMRKAGIGTVRAAEFAWTIFEPEEGIFSFELFDSFLDMAEQAGMKVIFCTPTAIPPVWLTEKYPEVLNCRKDGVLYRHGMRRHYNYNSETLRRLASRIVTQVAEHYAKRPCIVGWQIDNELNCEIDEYYSESDNAAFRVFLKNQYGTLEELNRAWGTTFWNQTHTSWDQVFVPRTTINNMVNPHLMLDFKRFISDSTIRYCKLQSDILRRYVKPGDFITTNGMFTNLDNHRMADACLDVFTYDSYPNFAFAMAGNPKDTADLNDRKWSKHLTEVRSVCPHFGIMEQQAGAQGWNTDAGSPAPKPGQLMLWTMQSVAHGADYVSYFRWRTCTRGTEMYWHGILDYDNRDNRKLAEVTQAARRLEAISEMTGADYVAPLGVVKDYGNVFDAQVDVWHGRVADSSDLEIFAASQLNHTPMDVVYLLESTGPEDLKKYPVLLCPHAEMVTEKMARLFEAYVRQGGTLIIGARTGQKAGNGQCVMAQMPGLLASLTQTAVEEYTLIGPADDPVSMNWDGEEIETGAFNDVLAVNGPDAKILAAYSGSYYAGKPAVIETAAGKGRVIHFGGVFTRKNLEKFFAYTGILEPFANIVRAPEECEIAVRRKDGQDYLIVLNFARAAQVFTLKQSVTDLDTNTAVSGPVSLRPFETKVYRI